MNHATTYLPKILCLAAAGAGLWAILSMPPGLNQRVHAPSAIDHDLHASWAQGHHPGAYQSTWDEVVGRWTR
jgi:hypothetical protein